MFTPGEMFRGFSHYIVTRTALVKATKSMFTPGEMFRGFSHYIVTRTALVKATKSMFTPGEMTRLNKRFKKNKFIQLHCP